MMCSRISFILIKNYFSSMCQPGFLNPYAHDCKMGINHLIIRAKNDRLYSTKWEIIGVAKTTRRTPRNYDGIDLTSHQLSGLLTGVLTKVSEVYQERPDLVLASWPEVIGPRLSAMTQALSFTNGVLVVLVKNSTLHSLLNQNDKPRILQVLRQRFPKIQIHNVLFRIG